MSVERGPGRLVSVGEVANKAGWSYGRMLRHLKAQDRELSGMLLVKVGSGTRTRYSLTLAALEQLHPQWAVRVSSLNQDVDDLRERLEEREAMLEEALKTIGQQGLELDRLHRRVDAMARRRAA